MLGVQTRENGGKRGGAGITRPPHKRPRPEAGGEGTQMDCCGDGGSGERFCDYSPYIKPDYKRLHPENATYID